MVEIKNLTKKYNDHVAVDNLSITVEDGQIYGFLGPNGAGKSTTMNIITGCLAATSGSVLINGYDILTSPMEAKRQIGYLPEIPPLYPDMTPREYLAFVCGLRGIKGDDVTSEIQRVAEITRIEDHLDRIIKNLSKGYKQRVGIAQAILGEPKLIILDEPTVGLDPKQITEIRDLIVDLGRNHTVILSSHILSEVSAICDKIMIIRGGKLMACDTPEGLGRMTPADIALNITVDANGADIVRILGEIGGISGFKTEQMPNGETAIEITYPASADLRREVSSALAQSGAVILSMAETRMSLEDIFLELTAPDTGVEPDETEEA